ncbi:MAG: DUF2934 domain-containing protein [Acidobacteriota bacterium]|nr:DUF2934 domain-containing protein [Acidobacteriota bacterium]
MEETGKKTKAPAKPRAASSTPRKTASNTVSGLSDKVTAVTPTHAEIARLAERFWAERGHTDGNAEQDWLRAEQELRKKAS